MTSRRRLLQGILAAAAIVVISPFTQLINYFYRKEEGKALRQKIANLKDLSPGSYIYFSYPQTGDPKVDNDPFRQFVLLMTSDGHLRVYSRVCVHLWCLPSYIPSKGQMICPCHGSIYRDVDGVAIEGPASYQPYPANALPMGRIEIDSKGDIWMVGVEGRIGYGREWRNVKPEDLVKLV
ncbi:Cytochrome b6-f complex iron-sulfur subunit [Candidatus Calditenuaceae archaeon HR02]|nr:Cytochrome b6-f complex iron-sulfur subunit [Candidatus Calditenuaceae archaeon HR02]